MRRASLRGVLNLTKRHLAAVLAYDLSLLMRHLTGHGTPKQWLAAAGEVFARLFAGTAGRLTAFITATGADVRSPGHRGRLWKPLAA